MRRLFWAYGVLILLGMIVLRLPHSMMAGNQLSIERAVFTSINAGTLTGFGQITAVSEYQWPGRVMVLVLMLAGSSFSLMLGGSAITRICRLPYRDADIIRSALTFHAMAILAGWAAMMIAGRSIYESLFLTVSAFGNCGLYIGQPPAPNNPTTHLVLLPLAIIGGLGISVLMELSDAFSKRRPISNHARTTLSWTAGLYLCGMILLLVCSIAVHSWRTLPDDAGFSYIAKTLAGMTANASAAALSTRSLGFPVNFDGFARVGEWMLVALMAIGAGSGGTSGGLKVTTLATLSNGVHRALVGRPIGRPFGIAICWLGLYTGVAFTVLLALLMTEPQMGADQLLFLAISALSNVGMSRDLLYVTGSGLYVLSAAMLAGRALPFIILWWVADTTTDAELAVG